MNHSLLSGFKAALSGISLLSLLACESIPEQKLEIKRLSTEEAREASEQIESAVHPELAEGFELKLWASDSLAPDPIALDVDEQGQVYITRTNRQKNSEFDIRGYKHWETASISFASVEDRRDFLKKTFDPDSSDKNDWFPDLNGDSLHDWRDLAVEQEEVFLLADEDGDGLADVSQLYIRDFDSVFTDVAGGLLVHEDQVFVGVGPDVWRMKDRNGDGMADWKESISHGYAIHIGFGAHGMSGLCVGPDGRIYWSIGDIGSNIVDQTGKRWSQPNQGAIFRSNPDGSNFEVFAKGLRNTHEFVFDKYGNLISEDNDGDHPGEKERLVYIPNGSDSGWRINWQFGKYSDPDNNSYKVWMDEELFKPRWEGQAAYILPPIMNYHSGPTGMLYNPGTALGPEWAEHFFIVEFVGVPNRSKIHAFQLQPKGAGFAFAGEQEILSGILPTGIDWAPDGSMMVADWIEGWGTKNYGRVWNLDIPAQKESEIRKSTELLIRSNFQEKDLESLQKLLAHQDMRIRQKAQFELAKRKDAGKEIFISTLAESQDQLARIHSIWGIWQFAQAQVQEAALLTDYLADPDPEIRAQVIKIMGDVGFAGANQSIQDALQDSNPRVKYFACEAMGRLQVKEAVPDILAMLEDNNDEDIYLRHGGAIALGRIGEETPLIALTDHESRALRIVAVVALRRIQSAGVAAFLHDRDEYIVAEAARGINDDYSIEAALPDLAKLLDDPRFKDEALLRRVINANLRLGTSEHADRLLRYVQSDFAPDNMRAEAIACLGVWAKPSVLDRVDGRYRGPMERDASQVKRAFEPLIAGLLNSSESMIIQEAAIAIGKLQLKASGPQLYAMYKKNPDPETRIALLKALIQLEDENMPEAIQAGLRDSDESTRVFALEQVSALPLKMDEKVALLSITIQNGPTKEQQAALKALADMDHSATQKLLEGLFEAYQVNKMNPEIQLEFIEAVEAQTSYDLPDRLTAYRNSLKSEDPISAYSEALYGGGRWRGLQAMQNNSGAQCFRCHVIRGTGGEVGPPLDGIANELDREALLRSLVDPSHRIAPGYGIEMLVMQDGKSANGILVEETENAITLRTPGVGDSTYLKTHIVSRSNAPSSMPTMVGVLSRREMRDIVELLASLKE